MKSEFRLEGPPGPLGDNTELEPFRIAQEAITNRGKHAQARTRQPDALCVAEGTGKFHVRNILDKLGASNRPQAFTIALQRGLARL